MLINMDIKVQLSEDICKRLSCDFIEFEILGRGAFNVNYLIKTKQDNFVLRISNNSHRTLQNEYIFLKQTNGKFGPRVFLYDESKKILPYSYLILEFIPGEHPIKITNDFLIKMGQWYKELHDLKSEQKPKYLGKLSNYSLIKSFEYRTRIYYENREILKLQLQQELDRYYEDALSIIKKYDDLFSDVKYYSANQGDPTRYNVILEGEGIRLIDWEFVKYNLREWDLAFFVWSYDLDKRDQELFLKEADYPVTQEFQLKFQLIYLLHCLMILSWKVERLSLISKGIIDKEQKSSNKKEVIDSILEDLPKIEDSLHFFSQ